MSPLGFKQRVGCRICIVKANVMYVPPGATPSDLFDNQKAASTVPHIPEFRTSSIICQGSGVKCIYTFIPGETWL